MPNGPELGLLGAAINQLEESSEPDDQRVRDLLSAALRIRGVRGDIFVHRNVSPSLLAATAKQPAETSATASELTLADLKTPNHFRDYFVKKLESFLGQQVELALPSQAYVDRGNRIQDAGLTTYKPVVFPDLKIEQDFAYPANWESPLNSWVFEQIKSNHLKLSVLTLKQLWGWLDTSIRLDWRGKDPMYDPDMDRTLADLLSSLRVKGEIAVPNHVRHLDLRSPFGVSVEETRTVVYPSLGEMFGAERGEVRDLTAAEFNFAGNLSYPHLGEANSWEWLNDNFGDDSRLIGGLRRPIGGPHGSSSGLSNVYSDPSDSHDGSIRFRPLIVS